MITIRHTHEDGTLVEGSVKGDGVYEIVKRHGFRYFPSIRQIGVRGSRDRIANRWRINAAAEALRTAGHEVTVEIDDNPRDRAQVLADQAERLDDRRDALTAKAARQHASAEAHYQVADRIAKARDGQPILIGHHSEARGWADQRRIERHMDAFSREYNEAKDTSRRADATGKAAAYSANPDVTARRMERTEADLRRIQRKLDGYTRDHRDAHGNVYYREVHEPASDDYREQLLAEQARLQEQRDYDREQLAAAQAAGQHQGFGPHNVHVGDKVRRWGLGWHEIVKVNRVSVSVATGYSWTDKIRYTELREVNCPHTTSAPAGDEQEG